MKKMKLREDMTKIDKKCIESGMTRADLSRKSGVHIRTLEAWACRKRVPRDVYVLQKIAVALGCHIEDLIEPEPEPNSETKE